MKRMRFIVGALVAVFAMSAFVVASASAAEGIFKDGTETPALKAKVTVASVGTLTLATTKEKEKNNVTCTTVEGTGEVNNVDRVEFSTVTFKGCNNATAGKCSNEGLKEGEILTKELSLLLGLQKQSGTEVWKPALLIGPLKEVKFVCGSGLTETKVTVKGCFVSLLGPAATELAAESSKGWLGTESKGLVFGTEFTQSAQGIQTGANAEGEMEFRDTPTSGVVKDRLLSTIENLIEKATQVSAEVGAGLLKFSEAVSIKA